MQCPSLMTLPWAVTVALVLLTASTLVEASPGGDAALAGPALSNARVGPVQARLAAGRLVLGYYTPYDPSSWASLQTQAGSIDVVAAQWVTIGGCGRLASQPTMGPLYPHGPVRGRGEQERAA